MTAAPKAPKEPIGTGLQVSLMPIQGFTDKSVLRGQLIFQCAPVSDFGPAYTWNYTDYDTIGFGTRTRPNNPGLATVSIDSLFVDFDYPFTLWKSKHNDPAHPVRQVQELKLIGDSMTPFLLLAGSPALWNLDYDIRMAATLRSFAPVERVGETDARYFTATFTEFRGIPENLLEAGFLASVGAATGGKFRDVRLIRMLPPGMRTMRQIAKAYYKSAAAWRIIAKANGLGGVGGDIDLVYWARNDPTRQIVIPALPQSQKGHYDVARSIWVQG